jgi:hypothetical protein
MTGRPIPLCFILAMILCIACLTSAEPYKELSGEASTQPDHVKSGQKGKFTRIFQALKNRYEKVTLKQDAAAGSGFRPRIGIIVPGSGLSIGAGYGRHILRSSASYSFRGYQDYGVQFGINPPKQSLFITSFRPWDPLKKQQPGFFLYADLDYTRLPQLTFYGIGPDSSTINRTNYDLEEATYDGVIGYSKKRIRLSFRGGFSHTDLGTGTNAAFPTTRERFSEESAPGLFRQPDFLHYGPSLLIDYRDSPGNPHSGGVVGMTLARFDDRGTVDRFNFNRLTLDARYFLPLGSPSRVFVTRFLTSLSDADSGSRVPFYMQETLGGSHLLRGFAYYRFRGQDLLLLSAEYRFEAVSWLEFALFYDTGKVFSKRAQFGFTDMDKGYGGGVRIKASAGTQFRIDGAKSDEGFMMYIRFDAPF